MGLYSDYLLPRLINRFMDRLIGENGFDLENLERFFMPGPKIGTYTYLGVARPSGREGGADVAA